MQKKKIKPQGSISKETSSEGQELYDMPLDKMDFEIVRKIIFDYVADEIVTDETLESTEEDKFLVLEVQNLEEGLKKAGDLLEVPIKELKYQILDTLFKDTDGEAVEFQKIEFRKKRVTGKCLIKISDDKLSAYLQYVFPKTAEGKEVDYEYLMNVLTEAKITYGIQHEELKRIVVRLKENYDVLQNILIAKGKPPVQGEDCKIVYSVFKTLKDISYNETREKYLSELLTNPLLERIKSEYFPVVAVGTGELIVSTTEPGKGTNGINVSGDEIKIEKGNLLFQGGKNVSVKIEGGKVNYYSEIAGYLENDGSIVSVDSPLWISEDFMEAYFIGLPDIGGNANKFEIKDIVVQLKSKGIQIGIKTTELENVVKARQRSIQDFLLYKIAEGEREKKGEDSRIELFFEKDRQVGKLLESGRMDYREIDLIKTVKENQLIAVKYFPTEGFPGKNLTGEIIPGPRGKDKTFNAINNVRTVAGKEKILYYSTIEGRVVLVGDSGISVNQLYEVKGNVDYTTGNVDFNGEVNVKGSVQSGFKIKAQGNINIRGMVNQGVELVSNGSVTIKQGVVGKDFNTKIVAKGMVFCQYLQNTIIEADSDIIVNDYILNCMVRTKGRVITPSKDAKKSAKGLIMGGETIALKGIIANTIGSEYAQSTKITVGYDYEFDKKLKNFQKALDYCESEINKLSKVSRVGFQDINNYMEQISKLSKEKQKPFLDLFKKMNEISQLKNEIINKRNNFLKETNELSQTSEVIVKTILHPKVLLQVGEGKMRTEQLYEKVKLKEHKNKKDVEISNLGAGGNGQ